MSEAKAPKIINLPESTHEEIKNLRDEFNHAKSNELVAKRKAKIARLSILNAIETALPEVADENYGIDYDKMTLEIKECDDCGIPGLPSHLADMLKSMKPEN